MDFSAIFNHSQSAALSLRFAYHKADDAVAKVAALAHVDGRDCGIPAKRLPARVQ